MKSQEAERGFSSSASLLKSRSVAALAGGGDAANPGESQIAAFTGPVWERSPIGRLTWDGGGSQTPSSAGGQPAGAFTDWTLVGGACLHPPHQPATDLL